MALRNLIVRIGGDAKDLDKEFNKAAARTKKFANDMGKIGSLLTRYVTLPIAGFGAAALYNSERATKAFKDFGESTKRTLGRFGDEIAKALNLDENLKKVAKFGDALVTKFAKLPGPLKTATVLGAAAVAAFGPAVKIAADLTTGIVNIAYAIKNKLLPVTLLLKVGFVGMVAAAAAAGIGIAASFEAATEQAEKLARQQERIKELSQLKRYAAGQIDEESLKAARGITPRATARQFPGEGMVTPLPPRGETQGGWQIPFLPPSIKEVTKELERSNEEIQAMQIQHSQFFEQMGQGFKNMGSAVTEFVTPAFEAATQGVTQITDTFLGGFAQSQTALDVFVERLREIPPLAEYVGHAAADIFFQLSQGIGDAIASIVVYGENAGEVFKALGKQILATIISTIIRIAVEKVVAAIASLVGYGIEAVAGLKTYAAITYAATFAGWSSIPLVGTAIAAGAASAAVEAMLGGAAASGARGAAAGKSLAIGAGKAEGGFVMTPSIHPLAEKGPELVMNKKNVRDFLEIDDERSSGRYGDVYLDRRKVGEILFPDLPGFLRFHGVSL